jgi:imidazolonepropionase-like amidohydrolase
MSKELSRRGALVAGLAAGATVGLAGHASAAVSAETVTRKGIAFTHATVIDATGARAQPDMTVVVEDDRIVSLGRFQDVRVPPGVRKVDLRGKYLIPGLCDMHVHSGSDRIEPALYVANGVTTVREMSGDPRFADWLRRIDDGTLTGPRWYVGSRVIDGSPSPWDPALVPVIIVKTEAEARAAVRLVKSEGADFVKVYTRLSREVLRAVADESRRQGLAFVGHCPDMVPLTEAVDLGQRSFEHLFGIFYANSRKEAELLAKLEKLKLTDGDYNSWFTAMHPVEREAALTQSPVKARALYAKLAARQARQVPTLILNHVLDNARAIPRDNPLRKYLPKDTVEFNDFIRDEFYLKNRTPQLDAEWAEMFHHRLDLVGEMHRAGVPIMAGTDTGTPEVYPGFALHEELGHLVSAGLSPMNALQAATSEPARFLGTERDTGTIARGKIADLVVLNANPLDDIRNTTKIDSVVLRGRYIPSDERTRMLADVEKAAAETPPGAAVAAGCACHSPVSRSGGYSSRIVSVYS